jgi:hypothetical protein
VHVMSNVSCSKKESTCRGRAGKFCFLGDSIMGHFEHARSREPRIMIVLLVEDELSSLVCKP